MCDITGAMPTDRKFTDLGTRRLGALIRERRENQLKQTQDDMAEDFGISQASLSAWETGKKTPSITSMFKLRDAFGLGDAEFRAWLELAGRRHTNGPKDAA